MATTAETRDEKTAPNEPTQEDPEDNPLVHCLKDRGFLTCPRKRHLLRLLKNHCRNGGELDFDVTQKFEAHETEKSPLSCMLEYGFDKVLPILLNTITDEELAQEVVCLCAFLIGLCSFSSPKKAVLLPGSTERSAANRSVRRTTCRGVTK